MTDKWKYKAKNPNKTQLYVEYNACKHVWDRNHSYINSAIVFHCQDGRQVASLQVFCLFKTSNIELLLGQIFEFNQKEECKQNHTEEQNPAKIEKIDKIHFVEFSFLWIWEFLDKYSEIKPKWIGAEPDKVVLIIQPLIQYVLLPSFHQISQDFKIIQPLIQCLYTQIS